jgi:hypothetical protein
MFESWVAMPDAGLLARHRSALICYPSIPFRKGNDKEGRPLLPGMVRNFAPIHLTTLPKRSTLVVCALTIRACAGGRAGPLWQYR